MNEGYPWAECNIYDSPKRSNIFRLESAILPSRLQEVLSPQDLDIETLSYFQSSTP